MRLVIFFFNDTATTEIYTLSLHDALPISPPTAPRSRPSAATCAASGAGRRRSGIRSEEHTSELQSQSNLVCRLLLEKKKVGKAKGDNDPSEDDLNLRHPCPEQPVHLGRDQ